MKNHPIDRIAVATRRVSAPLALAVLFLCTPPLSAQIVDDANLCGRLHPANGSLEAGFLDLGRQECWACPKGFERTLAPVTAPDSCRRKNASLFESGCRRGQFPDLGQCWSCPGGFIRNLERVDSGKACSKGLFTTAPATNHGRRASLTAAARRVGPSNRNRKSVAETFIAVRCRTANIDFCSNHVIRDHITRSGEDDLITRGFNNLFKLACERHDWCYRAPWREAEVSRQTGRAYCDRAFDADLRKICVSPRGLTTPGCEHAATVYFTAVSIGGQQSFDNQYDASFSEAICRVAG